MRYLRRYVVRYEDTTGRHAVPVAQASDAIALAQAKQGIALDLVESRRIADYRVGAARPGVALPPKGDGCGWAIMGYLLLSAFGLYLCLEAPFGAISMAVRVWLGQ